MKIPKEIVDRIKQRNNLSKEIEEEVKKWLEENNTYDITIEALGKQLPKPPFFEGDGYSDGELVYDTWICPCCEENYEVDYDKYDYCPNCGQKLDWGE